MAYTIVIDAGHGGADPGATYQGRQEKDDNLSLALAVGHILEQNGIHVVYTRTTDIYQTPFEKAQISNQENPDFFISFHRNSSEEPNQYSGVETLVYDPSGEKLTMAQNINGSLADLGFKDLGVKARPGLVVLRRTKAPALLVETGFLNTDADNQLYDEKQAEIARAIADAILGTLDQKKAENQAPSSETFYRVQTGLFRVRQNADRLLYELLDKGYPAFLLQEDGFFKVQVGAFRQLSNAILMERRLRRDGYATLITT
ncbi:MAG: N-acetylmuramoyl-L-alanine amidase [Fusicatenibacter sp.]|nr:N-acetylmuramoyl-L-alanine amidase [Lachnospiraceae bacterium]MDY2937419.1 N-acetylmuramoyl-L-alanine amidase [Fusicatenibacter sp.]